MKVEETTAGLRVEMAGDVLFDFDSDTIRSDAAESLAKISQIIRSKLKNRVIVIGHTDSKGSNKYNQELSERRALSVIRWLDKRESIPGFYLYAQGKGELQPKAPNTKSDGSDYPQGRATNRRVEIYIQ
jgi:outer membrane protein OmpA-like peptidoglycan-associated protein